MQVVSEKVLYEAEVSKLLESKPVLYEVLWAEDLVDYTIKVTPVPLKRHSDYASLKRNLSNRYLAFMNTAGRGHLRILVCTIDAKQKILYLNETEFNGIWRFLKSAINRAIEIQREENQGCSINKPEDILDLSELYRQGYAVEIKNDILCYVEMEISEEERFFISERDRILGKKNNIYFYAVQGNRYHDRDCLNVKFINAKDLRASVEKPEKLCACTKCHRRLLMRKATLLHPNQIRAIDNSFFIPNDISDFQLEKIVEQYGFVFEMMDHRTLKVFNGEDSWIIRLYGDVYTLFHNNYKMVESGRRIRGGYHDQNVRSESLMVLFEYIHEYSFNKHVEASKRKRQDKILKAKYGPLMDRYIQLKNKIRMRRYNRKSKYRFYKNNFVTQKQYNKTIDKMIKAAKRMESKEELVRYYESLKKN